MFVSYLPKGYRRLEFELAESGYLVGEVAAIPALGSIVKFARHCQGHPHSVEDRQVSKSALA